MESFDFDRLEITDKNYGEQPDFDFSKVFADGEEPEFDVRILDYPVGEYGLEDDDEDDGEGTSFVGLDPRPNRPSGSHSKSPSEDRELSLV